jgi:hypothetical protein
MIKQHVIIIASFAQAVYTWLLLLLLLRALLVMHADDNGHLAAAAGIARLTGGGKCESHAGKCVTGH